MKKVHSTYFSISFFPANEEKAEYVKVWFPALSLTSEKDLSEKTPSHPLPSFIKLTSVWDRKRKEGGGWGGGWGV